MGWEARPKPTFHLLSSCRIGTRCTARASCKLPKWTKPVVEAARRRLLNRPTLRPPSHGRRPGYRRVARCCGGEAARGLFSEDGT